ncbi:MAG: hypothetical protein ACI9JN_001442 [Bacteroidia bacterium]|jgi:hypothetical protein
MKYVTINSSQLGQTNYSVQRGKLHLDRFVLLLIWARHIDSKKGEALYYRVISEYWYRHEKDLGPPGPGSLRDYFLKIDHNCFYDAAEIQNAIHFITNDVIPSLEAYISKHGPVKYLVDEFGGGDNFYLYFEKNNGVIDLESDLDAEELRDSGRSMKMVFEEIREVLQDSLNTGHPYITFYH